MKILAVIPARGGSRRLPGKNLRVFDGEPLVVRAVRAATGIANVCDVLVSTDDAAIADVARAAGALVPWLRPAALATDAATSADVCLHALDWYESVHGAIDGLVLLAPTSPLRTRASIDAACRVFAEDPASAVVAVAPALSHPMWCFRTVHGRLQPFMEPNGLTTRSQDLPPAFVVTGGIYVIAPAVLRAGHTFFPEALRPIEVSAREAIDIDTEADWQAAEAAVRRDGARLNHD
jgi:CMP-N-acetylneuraminic acid synthetase